MVFEDFAAKVNLIAAEGPLEEDRMVALHGFSKFRIWNQLDVSMCENEWNCFRLIAFGMLCRVLHVWSCLLDICLAF